MKRILSTMLLVVLLASVFVGCAPKAIEAPSAATEAPVAAGSVTLEVWGFQYSEPFMAWLDSAFAQFITEHPAVKAINMSEKNDNDLEVGLITAAAAGELPDVFINATSFGAANVQAGVLNNIYDRWMAMPETYRSQFPPVIVEALTPEPGKMYALPFTSYGYVMYRNLTVLRAAGIDPAVPAKTMDEWLAQMQKVKDAGYATVVPNFSLDIRAARIMYNSFAQEGEWGIDFTNNKSLINPEAWVKTGEFLLKVKPFASASSFGDQGINDLFINNQLAFTIGGPWVEPTFGAAKTASGLDYDFTVIPGVTADRSSDVSGGEYISIDTNGKNADLAWELATFLCDEPQMYTAAETTGQTIYNQTAMERVTNPLVKTVFQGLAMGPVLLDAPPYFVEPYPDNYEQVIADNMNAIYEGTMTPQEAVAALFPELATLIADRNK